MRVKTKLFLAGSSAVVIGSLFSACALSTLFRGFTECCLCPLIRATASLVVGLIVLWQGVSLLLSTRKVVEVWRIEQIESFLEKLRSDTDSKGEGG